MKEQLTVARLYLRITSIYLRVTFPGWAWLPTGVLLGAITWSVDASDGTPLNPAWVHMMCACLGAGGAHRVRAAFKRHADNADAAWDCPHPDHRIRHIHGHERRHEVVAQCMECSTYFADWPGGHHGATRCWTDGGRG